MLLPNSSSSSSKGWFFATIFTIIVAVFVVPESGVAVHIGKQVVEDAALIPWWHFAFASIKSLAKYLVIFGYATFMFSFAYKKYFKKKLKNNTKKI